MDYEKEYRIAVELASTTRYREAKNKLEEILKQKPEYVDALILLGKVEYYLRLFTFSKQRFETALIYEPENMAAYFGLEYYRERKRKIVFITALISSLLVLIVLGFLSFFSITASLNKNLARIHVLNEYFNREQTLRLQKEEEILKKIHNLSELLSANSKDCKVYRDEILKEIEMLDRHITKMDSARDKLYLNILSSLENIIQPY